MAITLGCTLAEVFALSAAEFAFWGEYHARYGFPVDRITGTVAKAGAAVCMSNGAKNIDPNDLLPQFTRRKLTSAEIVAGLSGVPGVKVEKRARRGGAAQHPNNG